LRYLARYTHRVAISNRRLISADDKGVTFKWKDYRLEGQERYKKAMTLHPHEFIRRFLMHVLPAGFHRIRYYGFLTSQSRARNIARIRELLKNPIIPIDAIKAANAKPSTTAQPEEPKAPEHPCPCCGSRMSIIETFLRGQQPKKPPDAGSAEDQDRHIMMPEPMQDTCKYSQRRCWLSANNVTPCFVTSRSSSVRTRKRNIASHSRCGARSRPNSRTCCVAKSSALPIHSTTSRPEPVAKSP